MATRNEILVGVDGSPDSDAAVIWAAKEAASRGAGLMIVHAFDTTSFGLWLTTRSIRSELRELAQPIIDGAIKLAAETEPDVPARGRVLIGSPVRILLLLSAEVPVTVLGRSGRGALTRLWFGSVAQRVLPHASSPVVVVSRATQSDGSGLLSRVVVGVDGGAPESPTLQFAFEEAQRRVVPLCVIHAVPPPGWPYSEGASAPDVGPAAEARQSALLAPWQHNFPAVHLTSIVRTGRPGDVLTAACRPGDLMVLGHHRRAPFLPHQLGQVASAALHAALCPVAVVHEPAANIAKQQIVSWAPRDVRPWVPRQ